MRRKIIFALMILFAMRANAAYAHGVVGDYVFLEPLIAEDPTPANEFDILQRRQEQPQQAARQP